MRIISSESSNMVYHKPECRYARRIRKNRVQMKRENADAAGYGVLIIECKEKG